MRGEGVPLSNSKLSPNTELLFHAKHQKIIHPITLHKVVLRHQRITRFRCLLNDNVATYTMILSITVAINNPNLGSRPKRSAQIPQQSDGLINLVISLQQQHSIYLVRGKLRIVALAKDCLHIVQTLLLNSLVDVTCSLRINV